MEIPQSNQLSPSPQRFPDCCLGISSTLLDHLISILPQKPTFTVSVGSGSGLLEALIVNRGDVSVHGVEIGSSVNRYIAEEDMHVVTGGWGLCPAAQQASAWIFVYPRDPRLIKKYIDTYGHLSIELIVWLGPRVDWPDYETQFTQSLFSDLIFPDNIGLTPYEIMVVARKIRRVKCGEERPKCHRCTSTGRKCDFESDVSSAAPLTPVSLVPGYALSSSPNSGQRERRAFEYYFQHAARYLSGGMNIDFWTGVVPQICRTEPAVWDAIIAISSLFEYPEQASHFTFLGPGRQTSALNQAQKEALTWYSRSISGIHSQIDRGSADPYVSLVSCVFLIHDLRAKACHTSVSFTKVDLLENTIIPLFLRLNTVALTISGTPPSTIFSFSRSAKNEFVSLDSARQEITALAAECMIFQREAELHLRDVADEADVNPQLRVTQQDLIHRLESWLHAYTELCQRPQHRLSTGPGKPADFEPTLLTYHAASFVYVATCLTRHQSVYDAHLSHFQTIVDQSSLALNALARPNGIPPPFTFEMGVGLPLYLTALKCRHPVLRRKALQLSRQGPLVQGFYKCLPGIALAGHLMTLEETYSTQLAQTMNQNSVSQHSNVIYVGDDTDSVLDLAAPIPEEARICDAGVFRPQNGIPPDVLEANVAKWNRGPEQLFISFRRLRYDVDSDAWVTVHDCVPMEF
ncbi:unnamed protein product [Penicillium salamii]|uniref:Zn(2)-C6 fungal-type domain-containing protein n=1 Tax=Penicillium salamii TaxID=1612424 RepID=A0A9W4NCS9_9EURO|nr:unnamed protein product [Penicillium salamii]CAG8366593.1 unnamed protein product [Penicillium salamii]CAG8386365.1 unnamed protein product [Penicillium salamii]CAG8389445.1 unnamed protein product [Penicillium salamii]